MAEAAAHAAAIANAIKASGVLVRVDPTEFLRILHRAEESVIVVARGGLFRSYWRYLTSYKGLAFHTKSAEQLPLPGRAEIVNADAISIPG
jgi:hypothetical protein